MTDLSKALAAVEVAEDPDDLYEANEALYGAAKAATTDLWSLFPGLPRSAVVDALRIVEHDDGELGLSRIRELADREARADAKDRHERHVDLTASCYLCRVEAGAQTDRLSGLKEWCLHCGSDSCVHAVAHNAAYGGAS